VKLLQRAAEQKNAEAQYLLGRIYWEGRGVPRDRVQAHMWFNLAPAQGHAGAVSMRQVAPRRWISISLWRRNGLRWET
jgi:TPR repeat protein